MSLSTKGQDNFDAFATFPDSKQPEKIGFSHHSFPFRCLTFGLCLQVLWLMSCKKRELNPVTMALATTALPKSEFTAIAQAAKAALLAQASSVGSGGGATSPFADGEFFCVCSFLDRT